MKPVTQTIVATKVSKVVVPDIVLHPKNKSDFIAKLSLNDKPLIFQTPYLELVSDLKKTEHLNIYKIDVLLDGPHKNKVDEFTTFIEKLESHICHLVKQGYSCWFSEEKIVQQSMVSTSSTTNKNYLALPLIFDDNIVCDSDNKKLSTTDKIEKKNAKLIIEIPHMWIKNNQFGFVTNVKKIIVQKPQIKVVNDYVFDESDDDDNSVDKNTANLISLMSDRSSRCDKVTSVSSKTKSPPYIVELVDTLEKKQKTKKKKSDNKSNISTTDDNTVVLVDPINDNIEKISYNKKVNYFDSNDNADEDDFQYT